MPRIRPRMLAQAHALNPLLPPLLSPCRSVADAATELRWLREAVAAKGTEVATTPGGTHAGINGRPQKRQVIWTRKREREAMRSQDWDRRQRPQQLGELLLRMVRVRARGVPLQYVLGDVPFGGLDILCRPQVLIPRPETESYTLAIARLVRAASQTLSSSLAPPGQARPPVTVRLLDLCTGTGCIPLLFSSLLSDRALASGIGPIRAVGVDTSRAALRLARTNLALARKKGKLPPPPPPRQCGVVDDGRDADSGVNIRFVNSDVLAPDAPTQLATLLYDSGASSSNISNENSNRHDSQPDGHGHDDDHLIILTANPPYIAPIAYVRGPTARAVRLFEPRAALVPPPIPEATKGPEKLGGKLGGRIMSAVESENGGGPREEPKRRLLLGGDGGGGGRRGHSPAPRRVSEDGDAPPPIASTESIVAAAASTTAATVSTPTTAATAAAADDVAFVNPNLQPNSNSSPSHPATPLANNNTKNNNSYNKNSNSNETAQADRFYPALLAVAAATRASLVLLECGDLSQARRVCALARSAATRGGGGAAASAADADTAGAGTAGAGAGGTCSVSDPAFTPPPHPHLSPSLTQWQVNVWRCDDAAAPDGCARVNDDEVGEEDGGDGGDGGGGSGGQGARVVVLRRGVFATTCN